MTNQFLPKNLFFTENLFLHTCDMETRSHKISEYTFCLCLALKQSFMNDALYPCFSLSCTVFWLVRSYFRLS